MSSRPDQYYIDRIIQGDTQQFGVLVNRYKNLVFTLAIRMIKNREEAEEVAQDSFVKIFTHLGKFKGTAKFSTWVYKVTYNNCLDFIKARKRTFTELNVNDYEDFQIADLDNALTQLEEAERNSKILDCINALNPEEAFLLTLHYYEDHSLKEISSVMDISLSNVKVKLHRGRKHLAVLLQNNLANDIKLNHGK